MAQYWLLAAVEYVQDGGAVCHNSIPAAPVELDDDVAEALGDKVRPVVPKVEVEEEAPAKASRSRAKADPVKAQEADGS